MSAAESDLDDDDETPCPVSLCVVFCGMERDCVLRPMAGGV